jgi:hypothetical protein
MKSMERVERLISEQWPELKNKAQNQKDPERLIAVLEEIDDLLFSLEMTIAAQDRNARSRGNGDSGSTPHESFCGNVPGDPEIESQ